MGFERPSIRNTIGSDWSLVGFSKCLLYFLLEVIMQLLYPPHKGYILTERNLLRRINDCNTLIRRQGNNPFLKRIIIGDVGCLQQCKAEEIMI